MIAGTTRRTRLVLFTMLTILLGAMVLPPRAEAQTTIKDILGVPDQEVVGAIVFPGLSGSSAADVELDMEGYATADILEVAWSLDPASTAFRSLTLTASPQPLCGPGQAPCRNDDILVLRIGLSSVRYTERTVECFESGPCTTRELDLPIDLGPLDIDSDSVLTGAEGVAEDNCPRHANTDQADDDGDGIGNVCEPDSDGDTIIDDDDNCVSDPNTDQADADGDGIGDVCEPDTDDDGIIDDTDNCPLDPNANQADLDGDALGDVCDPDVDGDGIGDIDDNCPLDPNTDQEDGDGDGIGDVCDPETVVDLDGDGVLDDVDACLPTAAGEMVDTTGCSIADLCPCDNDWKNRGAYVACNYKAAKAFVKQGLITRREGIRTVLGSVKQQCGDTRLKSVLKKIQAIIRNLHRM